MVVDFQGMHRNEFVHIFIYIYIHIHSMNGKTLGHLQKPISLTPSFQLFQPGFVTRQRIGCICHRIGWKWYPLAGVPEERATTKTASWLEIGTVTSVIFCLVW